MNTALVHTKASLIAEYKYFIEIKAGQLYTSRSFNQFTFYTDNDPIPASQAHLVQALKDDSFAQLELERAVNKYLGIQN